MIEFDFVFWVMNPFILMSFAVVTGLLIGKIPFGKFTLGVSGTLFTGLFIGWSVYGFAEKIIVQGETAKGFLEAKKLIAQGIVTSEFFNLFLILFVAAVGLLAAKDMVVVLKKYGLRFIVLGLLVTFVGAVTTYGATIFSEDFNPYEVAGVYTGAMTSSPGLAAAVETAKSHAEKYGDKFETLPVFKKVQMLEIVDPEGRMKAENTKQLTDAQKALYISDAQASVGVGHAIGYPFGVLIVILAMNFFPKIFKMNISEEKRKFKKEMEEGRQAIQAKNIEERSFNLISFSMVCLLGYTVGSIKIYLGPLGYFSLGATGGVLIMALTLGYMGKIGPFYFRMDMRILSVIQNLGLAFFLAIVGLKYGYKTFETLAGPGIYLAAVSLFVGLTAMMAAFIIGRYLFKLNWVMLSGAICGGMTSTPGLGAATEALQSNDPAAGYGATYPFALLGMVIFTILLHMLPM